jgi:hypothetical protein
MENVVAELRERLERRRCGPAAFGSPEERLLRACSRGGGHVVVTGSDRTELHTILTRVLDTVDPLRAVRTLAVDTDPYATVDRVISALDVDVPTDSYLDRHDAMLALLARAEEVDKSIFVVVDDADRATVEQLEQLRCSLDVTPEAFARLRLVLVGDESLARRLEEPAAAALRSGITTHVTIDDPNEALVPGLPQQTTRSHALTFAVAGVVTFFAAAYSLYATGLSVGGGIAPRAATVVAVRPTRAAMYAIRGDEPFLDTTLRIAAVSAPPAKKVLAPKPVVTERPAARAPVAKPQRPQSAPATNTVTASAPRATPKPSPPATMPATGPSPGSSIDTFLRRFPAAR